MKLTTDQINYLNIGLMVGSATLAFIYPFELFLFVYAFLGPLHYLTEISWLHDRNYYTKGKYDYLYLMGLAVGVSAVYLGGLSLPKGMTEILTFLAFGAALGFLLFGNLLYRWVFLGLVGLAGLLFLSAPFFSPLFGIFLPTLVHVFIFTGLFILIGALRGRSFSGLLSLAVFVGVALSFVFFHPAHAGYHVGDYVRNSYGLLNEEGRGSNVFISLNFYLVNVLGLHDFGRPTQPLFEFARAVNDYLYQDPVALALMSFIAFAYTYHYLNWFSKTSIIRWHEVSRGRAAAIVSLWLASIVLYGVDYSSGFKWLFFLSFAHVLLEFPLDHLTMINIVKEGRFVLAPRGASGARR